MIVLGREVYVCKCATDVPREDPDASDAVRAVDWSLGGEEELGEVPVQHHDAAHIEDFRKRLRRGERWLIGKQGDSIVSYTWLHARPAVTYPYLPGCTFRLAPRVGYGYDAWTPPELRGGGLRRRGFLEELHVLRTELGCDWEASFFVSHQLEGATRSLGKVGIDIVPLWRVRLTEDRKVAFEQLVLEDESAMPMQYE